MPEFDLPTVIFALVALFVAWKLRSVLGMRQDSDRPGELAAPLRRAPGSASAACRPAGRCALGAGFAAPPRIAGRASPSPIQRSGAASTPLLERIAVSRRKPFCQALGALTTWSSMLSPLAIPTPLKP